MCFKRLNLFNDVLDDTGCPVSTIDNIRSFNMFLLQSSGEDPAPEALDIIKKTYLLYSGPLGQVTQVCQVIHDTIIKSG